VLEPETLDMNSSGAIRKTPRAQTQGVKRLILKLETASPQLG